MSTWMLSSELPWFEFTLQLTFCSEEKFLPLLISENRLGFRPNSKRSPLWESVNLRSFLFLPVCFACRLKISVFQQFFPAQWDFPLPKIKSNPWSLDYTYTRAPWNSSRDKKYLFEVRAESRAREFDPSRDFYRLLVQFFFFLFIPICNCRSGFAACSSS